MLSCSRSDVTKVGSRESESGNKSKRVVRITISGWRLVELEGDLEGGVVFDFGRGQRGRWVGCLEGVLVPQKAPFVRLFFLSSLWRGCRDFNYYYIYYTYTSHIRKYTFGKRKPWPVITREIYVRKEGFGIEVNTAEVKDRCNI